LAEPIKADLNLSDTDIGLINGFGFLIVYAVVGIPIARVADRGAFGLVISGCLTLWGAMTMLGGVANSGMQLALTRVGVAVGEAGSNPAAHAYVARNFPPERRAAPLAVTTMAIPLSSAVGLAAGGLIAEHLGWRTAFVIIGAVSIGFAPLVLLILGPRQPLPKAPLATAKAGPVRWWDLVKVRSYLAIVGGVTSISVAGYSLSTFAPAFLMRRHHMSLGDVGLQYGLASGAIGVVGLIIVGRLADRLSRKDPRWLLWVVAGLITTAIPFSCLAFVVSDASLAVVFIAISYVVGAAYMAPSVAAIQLVVLPRQRATASAIFLSMAAIVGSAGPFLTGLISDALHDELGAMSLGRALLIVPAAQLVALGMFFLASRDFKRDIVEPLDTTERRA
jgi:predicted MFS family arabinose efflux permease